MVVALWVAGIIVDPGPGTGAQITRAAGTQVTISRVPVALFVETLAVAGAVALRVAMAAAAG